MGNMNYDDEFLPDEIGLPAIGLKSHPADPRKEKWPISHQPPNEAYSPQPVASVGVAQSHSQGLER